MHRNCRTHPDNFCYVCGLFCVKSQRRPITNQLKNIYKLYFECPLSDQDKSWAPHVIYTSCSSGLRDWLNKRKVSMPFAIPMVWREQKNHLDDCYFCLIDITMCYCNDIEGLYGNLLQEHSSSDWRLFIDSSKRSLKAVLLHNGNLKPGVPIAHSVYLKETFVNLQEVLEAIQYRTHIWNICGDLKIIGLLMGLQQGFTKYYCFLCLWDSRATGEHYKKCNWPKRTYEVGKTNLQHSPLVDPNKVFLPPLHIKLGLMKTFVKTIGKTNSAGFLHLVGKFPKLSEAKLKEGVFVGPQIRQVYRDPDFEKTLSELEMSAWNSFKWVCENFLGNKKSSKNWTCWKESESRFEFSVKTSLENVNLILDEKMKLNFVDL